MRKMKTAIFGCGKISDIYISNMKKYEILDVCCCAATSIENARGKADQYGLEARTVEDIIKDTSIELIVNLTPPLAHYDLIKRSLLSGKHVFTEKVLACDVKEGKELIKLADDKNLYLGCAPETFLGGAIQAAKKVVDSGTIGQVTGCHASVNLNFDLMYTVFSSLTKRGGGIGMDRGIYFMTALCSILGPVVEVSGFISTLDPIRVIQTIDQPHIDETIHIESENQMVATIKFASGVLGTLNFNGNSILPEDTQLIIQGKEGILYLPDSNAFGGKVSILKSGNWLEAPNCVEVFYDSEYVTDVRGIGPAEMAYAIRNNKPHRTSKEMAFHMVEIFEGIQKSSNEKRIVKIESDFQVPEAFEKLI